MFVRNVSIQLKPNTVKAFTTSFETDILPALLKQKGFKDEVVLGVEGSSYLTAISFWDTKENADAYSTGAYPEILKKMSAFVEGTPKVRTAEVLHSTLNQITASAAPASVTPELEKAIA